MQIFVKAFGPTLTIDVDHSTKVEDLKQKVRDSHRNPAILGPEPMIIIFAGKELQDGHTIGQYHIQREFTLHLVQRMRGNGHPEPLVSVTCSDPVPKISSSYLVAFGRLRTLNFVPSDLISAARIRNGVEKALPGKVEVHYRPAPTPTMPDQDLCVSFLPDEHKLRPGDSVSLRLNAHSITKWDGCGRGENVPAPWIPSSTPFLFKLPKLTAIKLRITFKDQPPITSFDVKLWRRSFDLHAELAMAIASRAGLALDAIAELRCEDVVIQSRADVAELYDNDIVVVWLRSDDILVLPAVTSD